MRSSQHIQHRWCRANKTQSAAAHDKYSIKSSEAGPSFLNSRRPCHHVFRFSKNQNAAKTPMILSDPKQWDNAAAEYNNAVGKSSRLGAARLITLANELHSLSSSNARAIDHGAGTGSFTHLLSDAFPSLPILSTDISPGILGQLKSIADSTGKENITTQVVDMASPAGGAAAEGSFSHVFSTMAIQVLPDTADEGTLDKWASLLAPGGVIAFGVWDFDEKCGPNIIWAEAAQALDSSYESLPMLPQGIGAGEPILKTG
jgi:SAM-dependent methyltransferase